MLWIAVPGNAHELEVCKRKGVGIDFSVPEGHAGPKSQVRGVAALVSMWGCLAAMETRALLLHRRLEAESNAHRRDASFGYLEQEGDKTELAILVWSPGNLLRTGHKLHFWTRKPAHFRTRKLARFGTRIWQRFSTVFCFPGSLPFSWFPRFLVSCPRFSWSPFCFIRYFFWCYFLVLVYPSMSFLVISFPGVCWFSGLLFFCWSLSSFPTFISWLCHFLVIWFPGFLVC